jgi:hypothetical protein
MVVYWQTTLYNCTDFLFNYDICSAYMNDQLIKEFITQVQFESGMHAADLSIYTYVIP